MHIEGRFFDGASSRSHPASVVVEGRALRVQGEDGELLAAVALGAVQFSSRVGNTPRFLRFPDGASFETSDNDTVDRLAAERTPASGLAHRLESKLRYAMLGLAVTIAFVWGSVQWGVPALAKVAAFSLPAQVHEHADRLVLDFLDDRLLAPSRLPPAEQARLQAAFAPIVAEVAGAHPVRVLFRDAKDSIEANALALPAGTIVFTDQLVHLAKHDDELLGILAHELGHVVNRHAMRSSIQASAVSLLAALVVGDLSSVSSAVTALPVLLTELGYSREFEREADSFAVQSLHNRGIDPRRFADILQRLDPADSEAARYLSTHPPTPERVRRILQ